MAKREGAGVPSRTLDTIVGAGETDSTVGEAFRDGLLRKIVGQLKNESDRDLLHERLTELLQYSETSGEATKLISEISSLGEKKKGRTGKQGNLESLARRIQAVLSKGKEIAAAEQRRQGATEEPVLDIEEKGAEGYEASKNPRSEKEMVETLLEGSETEEESPPAKIRGTKGRRSVSRTSIGDTALPTKKGGSRKQKRYSEAEIIEHLENPEEEKPAPGPTPASVSTRGAATGPQLPAQTSAPAVVAAPVPPKIKNSPLKQLLQQAEERIKAIDALGVSKLRELERAGAEKLFIEANDIIIKLRELTTKKHQQEEAALLAARLEEIEQEIRNPKPRHTPKETSELGLRAKVETLIKRLTKQGDVEETIADLRTKLETYKRELNNKTEAKTSPGLLQSSNELREAFLEAEQLLQSGARRGNRKPPNPPAGAFQGPTDASADPTSEKEMVQELLGEEEDRKSKEPTSLADTIPEEEVLPTNKDILSEKEMLDHLENPYDPAGKGKSTKEALSEREVVTALLGDEEGTAREIGGTVVDNIPKKAVETEGDIYSEKGTIEGLMNSDPLENGTANNKALSRKFQEETSGENHWFHNEDVLRSLGFEGAGASTNNEKNHTDQKSEGNATFESLFSADTQTEKTAFKTALGEYTRLYGDRLNNRRGTRGVWQKITSLFGTRLGDIKRHELDQEMKAARFKFESARLDLRNKAEKIFLERIGKEAFTEEQKKEASALHRAYLYDNLVLKPSEELEKLHLREASPVLQKAAEWMKNHRLLGMGLGLAATTPLMWLGGSALGILGATGFAYYATRRLTGAALAVPTSMLVGNLTENAWEKIKQWRHVAEKQEKKIADARAFIGTHNIGTLRKMDEELREMRKQKRRGERAKLYTKVALMTASGVGAAYGLALLQGDFAGGTVKPVNEAGSPPPAQSPPVPPPPTTRAGTGPVITRSTGYDPLRDIETFKFQSDPGKGLYTEMNGGMGREMFGADLDPNSILNSPAEGFLNTNTETGGDIVPTNNSADLKIEPTPEISTPSIKEVSVAASSKGSIDTIVQLQKNLSGIYGGDATQMPPSVKQIVDTHPAELAKKLGFYNPEKGSSAILRKGEFLSIDSKGNLVYQKLGGESPQVLISADGKQAAIWNGKMSTRVAPPPLAKNQVLGPQPAWMSDEEVLRIANAGLRSRAADTIYEIVDNAYGSKRSVFGFPDFPGSKSPEWQAARTMDPRKILDVGNVIPEELGPLSAHGVSTTQKLLHAVESQTGLKVNSYHPTTVGKPRVDDYIDQALQHRYGREIGDIDSLLSLKPNK